jgi:hypothetical protein
MKNIEEEIYKISEESFSLILKCILNRTPVLIAGSEEKNVELFGNSLADLMNFRAKSIFYTDFISNEELDMMLQQEETDYDIKRNIIFCPCNVLQKAMQTFEQFKSWILCYYVNDGDIKENINSFNSKLGFVLRQLQKKENVFLLIETFDNEIRVNLVGQKFKEIDLKFEKNIYSKAITFVDNSINKMQRIFVQRLSLLKNYSNELKNELLDFNFEELNLKKNMFKIHILEFYNAARRAFSILNKMTILNSLNIKIELSDKTLLDTISYDDASYTRLLEFIKAEWGDLLSANVDAEPIKYKHDLIESLWG